MSVYRTIGPTLVFLYDYTFYSRYNTVWIANMEIGLDPNNSVIKRLWCSYAVVVSQACDCLLIFV